MKGLRNHFCNGKRMLTPLMLTAVLFSCKKEDIQQPEQSFETQNAGAAVALSSSNIIYSESFEGSSFFDAYVKKQTSTSYGITQSTGTVFAGSKAGRFEIRDGDPEASGGTRSEVLFPEQSNLNRWYAFSVYFPSAQYKYDSEDELIAQWHQGGGTTQSLCIRVGKDKWLLRVKPTTSTTQYIELGALPKDKWTSVVMHVKHSSGSDGLIEMWINGQKVVNRAGANMYSLSSGQYETPRYKIGVYKADWNGTSTTETTQRVVYFDNVVLGNEKATYAEIAAAYSGSGSGSTDSGSSGSTVAPSPITGFTLVNSATERDVVAIANGATISLSQYSLNVANIRTSNAPAGYASVKMELSGQQSKTYVDNQAPFALHGDSGTGNYYFGNWAPPATGTYTLKATPYTGSNATGTAGTPYSVTFTITN